MATADARQGFRARINAWVESAPVQNFVLTVIALNAITLGVETTQWGQTQGHAILRTLDIIALTIFVIEIGLKLIGKGWRFFLDGWNLFDFIVVAIALIPGSGPFAVLRGLRVLRVLRVIHIFPRMKFIIEALMRSLPGIGAIAGLLGIIFYVSAVMATQLFGQAFPDWFGSFWRSLFSLFQVMSLEGWPDMVRVVMEEYSWAWGFFIPFILFSSFTILNLFIGIIVDTMQTVHEATKDSERAAELAKGIPPAFGTAEGQEELYGELSKLRSEIAALRETLATRPN